jgi:hypothetical protein
MAQKNSGSEKNEFGSTTLPSPPHHLPSLLVMFADSGNRCLCYCVEWRADAVHNEMARLVKSRNKKYGTLPVCVQNQLSREHYVMNHQLSIIPKNTDRRFATTDRCLATTDRCLATTDRCLATTDRRLATTRAGHIFIKISGPLILADFPLCKISGPKF